MQPAERHELTRRERFREFQNLLHDYKRGRFGDETFFKKVESLMRQS